MSDHRTVRLFKNGRSQALRIPKEMEFDCTEVEVTREGMTLIVTAKPQKPSLAELLANWDNLAEEWPENHDEPPRPFDL